MLNAPRSGSLIEIDDNKINVLIKSAFNDTRGGFQAKNLKIER